MSADEERPQASREQRARRIRSGIRIAQLRIAVDDALGREAPRAVGQLAPLPMPPLPSPFDTLRSPDGKLLEDPASRREMALYLRRGIRGAQLRVALDGARGRPTPGAVKRLAQLKPPTPE